MSANKVQWHKAVVDISCGKGIVVFDHVVECRTWCEKHLSSEGELWVSAGVGSDEWWKFYFREEEDAIVFKLALGL
jgi:hypothetical protein